MKDYTRSLHGSLSFLILLLMTSLPAFGVPRPIVEVITPDGSSTLVPTSDDRWGLPEGIAGSRAKPISVRDVDAVSFRIGDNTNPDWNVGSSEVGSANPQTTFPRPLGQLDVFCIGCNGPKPSMTILHWSLMPLKGPRMMVARVSLGVDATDPQALFNDSNSIHVEVWFVLLPPTPLISDISHTHASAGSRISIVGSGFSAGNVKVSFDGVTATNVEIVNDTTILVEIPGDLSLGPTEITVTTDGGTANLAAGANGLVVLESAPTLSEWGMILMVIGLAGSAVVFLKRHQPEQGKDSSERLNV